MITPCFAMVKRGVERPELQNLFTAVKRLLKNLHQLLEISSCISIASRFAAAPFLSDCIICLISFISVVTSDCNSPHLSLLLVSLSLPQKGLLF